MARDPSPNMSRPFRERRRGRRTSKAFQRISAHRLLYEWPSKMILNRCATSNYGVQSDILNLIAFLPKLIKNISQTVAITVVSPQSFCLFTQFCAAVSLFLLPPYFYIHILFSLSCFLITVFNITLFSVILFLVFVYRNVREFTEFVYGTRAYQAYYKNMIEKHKGM